MRKCLRTKEMDSKAKNEWNLYLGRLGRHPGGVVSEKQANDARTLWEQLTLKAPRLAAPQAGPSKDGDVFQMIWNQGAHHLEVDFTNDEPIRWFYLHRPDDKTEGGCLPSQRPLSADFLDVVQMITGG